MTPEVEARVFEELWAWLQDLRAKVHAEGKTFRAYCYNAGVEGGHLRRLALAADRGPEVEAFLASDEWVDLLRVFDSQLITGWRSGPQDRGAARGLPVARGGTRRGRIDGAV